MKVTIYRCSGQNKANTGYAECPGLFLSKSGPCPVCGGGKGVLAGQVEIPGIKKAHGLLEIVITSLNTKTEAHELLKEKNHVRSVISILEGV